MIKFSKKEMDVERKGNRYAPIHILFRQIAKAKGHDDWMNARKVKKYWKNLFNINSLTELEDWQLNAMEKILQERLKAVKQKDERM
ncbi:hypothetical protein KAW50_03455 [candidate division WOR-3 bacterium]|nr:hypothetical protein [candidate division WOR-3 bacterium]